MVSSRWGALGLTWWFRVRDRNVEIYFDAKQGGFMQSERDGRRGGVKVVKEEDAEVHDER
jgi:hypothetical protein